MAGTLVPTALLGDRSLHQPECVMLAPASKSKSAFEGLGELPQAQAEVSKFPVPSMLGGCHQWVKEQGLGGSALP